MNCQNCNHPLPAGAVFCGNCGAQVVTSPPLQQAPQPSQQQPQPLQQAPAQQIPYGALPQHEQTQPPISQSTPPVMQQQPVQPNPTVAAMTPAASQVSPQPLQPGQPGFPGVPIQNVGITEDLKKAVKTFSTIGLVLGPLYMLASSVSYVVSYNETGDASILAYLPADVILGGLILVSAIRIRNATNLSKIRKNANLGVGAAAIILIFAFISGQFGGILLLAYAYFGYKVTTELKKVNA